MNSLFELEKNYRKADARYDKRQNKLREQKAAIEAQMSKMKYPHFIEFLNKFGRAVVLSGEIKGAVGFEVMGPFGLGNECSIYFYSADRKRKTLAGATFTRYGDGYGLKDYSKNTGKFRKGSIGELSGGNYETIEITKEMTIDWFVKFAKRKQNKS